MVSIIVPVLNEASAIAVTLERVLSLEGRFEVIVVDGGSSDDTAPIARRYVKVIPSRKGRCFQMNLGAEQSRGDALLFLHADTILPPNAIPAIELALANPKVAGGRFRVKLNHPGWIYRLIGFNINLRDRIIGGFTGDQAIFVRSSVFRKLGGYREITLMEDLDFGKRMTREGKAVILPLKVTTSARRWQKDGILRTIFLMWALRLMFALRVPPSRLKRFYGETR